MVTSWFLPHWSTPEWTGNTKSVQCLLARWWRHDFYSIGSLRNRLAIQNQFNICSLGGDVMLSTALIHSGIDWQYKISSTFARYVLTPCFLQHWSTPERTGNTKSVQHLLVRWWRHDFYSIGPFRSRLAIQNKFNICSLDGAYHYLLSLVRYKQIDLMFYVYQVTSNGVPHWIWMDKMKMKLNPELRAVTKHTWNYFAKV